MSKDEQISELTRELEFVKRNFKGAMNALWKAQDSLNLVKGSSSRALGYTQPTEE